MVGSPPPANAQELARSTVSVTVLTQDGRPVSGADVTFRVLPRYRTDPAGRILATIDPGAAFLRNTGTGGEATVEAASSRSIQICVKAEGFLDPCEWPTQRTVFPFHAEESGKLRELRLDPAAVLRFHLTDIDQLAYESTSPLQGDAIKAGVLTSKGAVHLARVTSRSSQGKIYSLKVPVGQDLRIWLFSHVVRLEEAGGRKLEAKGPENWFRLEQGTSSHDIYLNVAGKMEPPPPTPPRLPVIPDPPPLPRLPQAPR